MLKELIYKHFEKEDQRESSNELTLSPTGILQCGRKYAYKKLRVLKSNPIQPASSLKMEFGTAGHETIEKILSQIKDIEIIKKEYYKSIVYSDVQFNYIPDMTLKKNDIQYVLEIKTVYAAGFYAIENQPKPEHVFQGYLYCLFENIPNLIILYAGRDNGFLVEYVIENILDNEEIKTELNKKIEHYKAIFKQIEKKEMPEREYNIVLKKSGDNLASEFQKDNIKYKSDWQCSYCDWHGECWKDVIVKMKDYKFFINNEFIS